MKLFLCQHTVLLMFTRHWQCVGTLSIIPSPFSREAWLAHPGVFWCSVLYYYPLFNIGRCCNFYGSSNFIVRVAWVCRLAIGHQVILLHYFLNPIILLHWLWPIREFPFKSIHFQGSTLPLVIQTIIFWFFIHAGPGWNFPPSHPSDTLFCHVHFNKLNIM